MAVSRFSPAILLPVSTMMLRPGGGGTDSPQLTVVTYEFLILQEMLKWYVFSRTHSWYAELGSFPGGQC